MAAREDKGDDGTMLGFGATLLSQSDELRHDFETKYQGDEARFFKFWPQGFRWTCCGCTGDMEFGCDHHGSGSTPCTCDFCHMGKPLPDALYMQNQQATRGLSLRRGPDPRSFNPIKAGIAAAGRGMMGLPTDDSDTGADAPFSDVRDKVQMITKFFTQSPSAAAQFADAQRRVDAEKAASSSNRSSSSSGNTAGSSCGAAAKPSDQDQDLNVTTWVCTVCGVEKPVKLMFACSGCKVVKKVPCCSRDCQAADWPQHKAACKLAQKAAGHV